MKIRTIIIFIIFLKCFLQSSLFCQTVYFNKTINLADEWGLGMSVITNDSTYHIAAITGPGKMISIVEVSLSGEEKWIKKYGNSQENWYPGNPGSLCPFSSSGYILGGSVEGLDNNYGLLLRFNSLFDTSFSRRYSNDINYSMILTCAIPTFDGGIILTGEISTAGSNTDFILLKTDSLGNELWRTTKTIGYLDRGWSVIQTPDSGFVVGGYSYNPGAYHTGDPLIVKFDKFGSFLWSRNPGGPYEDSQAMVCQNEDSTITVLTAIADSVYVYDFDYARICLIKYSQNGEELWKKKYGESIGGNFISSIKLLPDGGYICCGTQREPGNNEVYRFGWLLCLNVNGDSIWFRKYTFLGNPPNYYNNIMEVSLAQDGGFITTGEVWDDDPPNGLQRIWVLKVDSIGCDSAGCDTTVGIKERHGGVEAWWRGGMEIWPNPAGEILNFKFSVLNSGGDYNLIIYDIFGREIYTEKFSSTLQGGGWEGGRQINVESYPPGVYIAVLKNGFDLVESRKFVVTR